MAYLTDGFSAEEMIARVAGVVKSSTAAAETMILQLLNATQLEMFYRYDWPELRVQDDYFTTDGSESYSLASVLNNANKAGFGRVVANSVRYGSYSLSPITKGWIDQYDPERIQGGTPLKYCAVNRTDFRVWPYGSSGDKISLDWVILPVKLEAASAADDVSFDPERHELIIEGTIWRACREEKPDLEWERMMGQWYRRLKEAYRDSRQFKQTSFVAEPHYV
jgi:hypothetical protein